MYLLCCPRPRLAALAQSLAENQIMSLPLPLMDFAPDPEKLAWLTTHINNYAYVILNSPTVIEYSSAAIKQAYRPKFFTVGQASADKLRSLTSQEVIYPEMASGSLALLTEKLQHLKLIQQEVLIVKGDLGNLTLPLALETNGISWHALEIYRRIRLALEPGYLKKILISEGLRGIIITSSMLVEWLLSEAQAEDCLDLLSRLTFITLHSQIAQALTDAGMAKVLVTKQADRRSIAELIRNLHDGYNQS
jgi:uroporphyrinogen-III synthase